MNHILKQCCLVALLTIPAVFLHAQINEWSDLTELQSKTTDSLQASPHLMKYRSGNVAYLPVREKSSAEKKYLWTVKQFYKKGGSNQVTIPMRFINDYRIMNDSQVLVIGQFHNSSGKDTIRPSVSLQTFKKKKIKVDTVSFINGTCSYRMDEAGFIAFQDTNDHYVVADPEGKIINTGIDSRNFDSVLISAVHIIEKDTLIYAGLLYKGQPEFKFQLFRITKGVFSKTPLVESDGLNFLEDSSFLVRRKDKFTIFRYGGKESAGGQKIKIIDPLLLIDDGANYFWVNPSGEAIQFGKNDDIVSVFPPVRGDKDLIVMCRQPDGKATYRLLKKGKLVPTSANADNINIPETVVPLYKTDETAFFIQQDRKLNSLKLKRVTPDKNNILVVEDVAKFPGATRSLQNLFVHEAGTYDQRSYLLLADDINSGRKCGYMIIPGKAGIEINEIKALDSAQFVRLPLIENRVLIYVANQTDWKAFDLVKRKVITDVALDGIMNICSIPAAISDKAGPVFYGKVIRKDERTILIRYPASVK